MRKMTAILATLFLFVGGFSYGQEPIEADKFVVPVQTVIGAEEVISRNEIVILKVNPPGAIQYLERASYTWKVLVDGKEKKNLLKYPDNMTIAFGIGKAEKIQVFLVCSYLYVVREQGDPKGKIVEVAQRTSPIMTIDVKIDGAKPEPDNPNPQPDPKPPVIPDTKLGLTKFIYNTAQKVDPAYKVKGAQAYAKVSESISTRVQAGAITGLERALLEFKAAGITALKEAGVPANTWNAAGIDLQDNLYALYQSGKLTTKDDVSGAFTELANGLKLVK